MLFIKSEVKVAMPHLRGGKDEINATFLAGLFGIILRLHDGHNL
jgi:hypothetical protein